MIASTQEAIHILAIPQIEGANVTITGADNIQFGENIITIKVVAKDGVTSKEYTVNLYKTTQEEENQNIEPHEETRARRSEKNWCRAHYILCYYHSINSRRHLYASSKI